MMTAQLLTVLTLFTLLYKTSESYSACDEVNVIFLVDTESIKNNGDNVIEFISKIASDGTSEHSSFSVVVYGDNIPDFMDINLMKLTETGKITDRQKEEFYIRSSLESKFRAIDTHSVDNVKSVGLLHAFDAENRQENSVKMHHAAQYIGAGLHDDENEYFVFNYDNVFETSDICELLRHGEGSENMETVHILLGQSGDVDAYTKQLYSICASNTITQETVFNFNDIVSGNGEFDETEMEFIYSITCPAEVDASDEFGPDSSMELGNHVQWIDEETVLKCVLTDDSSHPYTARLTADSYILIKDVIDDDNTFKKNDYLLAEQETLRKLSATAPSCCNLMPVKIVKIEDDNEHNLDNAYIIRRLYVRMPNNPWEYILNSHVSGKIRTPQTDLCGENQNNYRRLRADQYDADIHVTLVDVGDEYTGEYDRQASVEKKGNQGDGTITANATGDVHVDWGFAYELQVWLNFKYYWSGKLDDSLGEVDVEFSVEGFFEAKAWFNVEVSAKLTVKWKKILFWSKTFGPTIAGIPITIRPFLQMDATLHTIPFSMHGGVECTFRHEVEVGFWMYTANALDSWDSGDIDRSETTKKECVKRFGVGDEENDILNSCDPVQLGFDVTFDAYVGASLYEIFVAWLRAEVIIPFRIEVPELNTAICSGHAYECSANSLQASFKIEAIELSFYVGYERGSIFDLIVDFIDPEEDDPEEWLNIDLSAENEKLLLNLELLPTTTLGCLPITDILPKSVTSHIGSLCCPAADAFADLFGANSNSPIANSANATVGGKISPSYIMWFILFIPMIVVSICLSCICGRLSTKVERIPKIDDAEFDQIRVRNAQKLKGCGAKLKAVLTAGTFAGIVVIVVNTLYMISKYPPCGGEEHLAIITVLSWVISCVVYFLIRKVNISYSVAKIPRRKKILWSILEKILIFNVALAFICVIVFKPMDDCYFSIEETEIASILTIVCAGCIGVGFLLSTEAFKKCWKRVLSFFVKILSKIVIVAIVIVAVMLPLACLYFRVYVVVEKWSNKNGAGFDLSDSLIIYMMAVSFLFIVIDIAPRYVLKWCHCTCHCCKVAKVEEEMQENVEVNMCTITKNAQ